MTYKKQLEKRVLAGLLAGAALWLGMPAALAASGAVPNTQLPQGGHFIAGGIDTSIVDHQNGQMTITQGSQNAVIQWGGGFNVGANATVNFEGPANGYNTLNYDASGNMSQIYGAINANNKGNIYIVNPAGVEISSSAQINVGSLYVSNKKMADDVLKNIKDDTNITNLIQSQDANTNADAVLMSLGNINAANVTFDGGRIVIDTERLKTGDAKMGKGNIHVRTTDAGQVVLGYDGYDESSNKYGETKDASELASVTDEKGNAITTDLYGYMWVEDIEQLQAVNTSGQYALRNSIDATATQDWADSSGKGFVSIGSDGEGNSFTGKFDGLDYNIFNLNIDRAGGSNVGLFGVVGNGAVIRNVTLVGGSIKGRDNVGALAGQVSGGAQISNIMNSASVTGSSSNVGGIIGSAGDSVFENLVNTGTIAGTAENTENNVGGLIGSLSGGTLSGTSYNLGGVTGNGYNVGGLVGTASGATLGDGTNLIYNRLNVSGEYNVGGIVGSMSGTTVQNAENSGNVTATGYTAGTYSYHSASGEQSEQVTIANVGGIAGTASDGSTISNVQNSGDVSSGTDTENGYTYYTAGNVGGIVGSAVDTNISNATNEENDIRGAHNVGGIAGYFGSYDTAGKYTITRGINSGGNIMATGARNKDNNGFVTEWVRSGSDESEEFIVGNMGGIAGYLDGDNVYIVSGANRGTVHSQDITGNTVLPVSQAANAGGIVGKIDRSNTLSKDKLETDYANAAVSNSYNTGDVMGYTGVGGVAGMMYNGEIAGSYNLGYISTTRQNGEGEAALNMGGIVGDTTEESHAKALLYDVYNKGQIGDETFTYYARHVGGIVGRLSGTVEKAYNTGAIYNGSNVVGGIAGWMYEGSITNAFNTGNITVSNHNNATSQVGGIVGAANLYAGDIVLQNVYNLGTLRSFTNRGSGENSIGGIIGEIFIYGTTWNPGDLKITNAYTLGNIYSRDDYSYADDYANVHPMLGKNSSGRGVSYKNTYYIQPGTSVFNTLTETGVTSIAYADRHDKEKWKNFRFSTQKDGDVDTTTGADWRIYDDDSLPILNAFLPKAEDYFSKEENMSNISSIQYGTAYDPLLTIIKADENLTFDWQDLGISNAAGIAVYGAGLTLNDFMVSGGSGYFGGLIYSDGALAINATSEEVTGNVALGSASQLYGSSVSISADGNVTIYGNVTATGNTKNGATGTDNAITDSGDISITGGSVDIYGQLTSAEQGKTTTVPGIDGKSDTWNPTSGDVSDRTKPMTDLGDRFGYTTGKSAATGSISITANGMASEDGHVNVYYGHQQKGFLNTAGNLTVSGFGDVYMDSDLSVGGNLSITAGADSEAVLDISNIGQVQATEDKSAVAYLHDFLTHFATKQITLNGGKQKIAVDMWTDNAFDLNKFDYNGKSLSSLLNGLNINGFTQQGQKYTYIWVSTGEQLAGIQQADSSFLGYNFALKNDIDASVVKDYVAIGTGSTDGFTGTFDGRDQRIIGLNVTGDNAGIFDTIGTNGKVEDLRVYSGTFSGTDNAGAVAGINKGTISNVTTFGNVVTAQGSGSSTVVDSKPVGAAGGIAGVNAGAISGISASDTVTADDAKVVDGNGNAILSAAGGIAGINAGDAKISDSSTNSAVNASAGSTYALGGIAGVNSGNLSNVDSLGVTTGIYEVGDHNSDIDTQYSDNVGGIAGRNSGTVSEAYNESIVSGRDNVGGILGTNTGANVTDVSNAARVTGEAASNDTSDYVGGLVGSNSGSITNGRNNGEITGNQYVGGLVGNNASGSKLSNLVNDEAASIIGDNYVGGIAGRNYGTISANDEGLVNRGSITGQMYVGGVAGSNEEGGIIENTISSIALHVKTPATNNPEDPGNPKYFGGVVGQNSGTINGATNESSVDVAADGATMVGGIIGQNTENGKLEGTIANEGFVSGKSDVGGIIGSNENQNILNNADTDENGQPNKRLVVSNSGRVQAEGGGAAGIFYENTGAINNADLINTGMVIGGSKEDSVTGGLFGKNSGNITNSTLTNNGTVYGGGTVGGLIGKNTGDISTSSLINSVNGKVIGLNNVGGLIGQNYGTITGGRTETDGTDVGYYKYQIYNNGTIQVGTWNDSDQDDIIDTNEFTEKTGENIGGLVGLNGSTQMDDGSIKTGSITAAYNTGAIIAGSSTNVGGIAGSNTGTLDQVFNTVITGVDDKGSNVYGSITGNNYVGGIVGSNTGTVSNAYNTSTVSGSTAGAIAGTNNGTISNVYTTVSGGLVGKNDSGTIEHNYDVSTSDTDWEKAENYEGFDFTGTNGNSAVWKIYEGSTNPLLKVFLTKVTYDPENGQNLVYNGKDQTLDVIGNGFTAADDFAAHNNVSGGLIYHDVVDVDGGHKNAGTYTDNLWSEQIKAGSTGDTFNPNNLGYDVQSVEYKIKKATLDVTLNDIYRQYGNSNMYTDEARTSLNNDYKGYWTISVDNQNDFDQDVLKNDLAQISSTITDDGKADGTNGRVTANAGDHNWSVEVDISAISQNYQLKDDTSESVHTYEGTGQSHVAKADLTINLGTVNRTYGDTKLTNGTKYGISATSELVNGDSGLSLSGDAVIDNALVKWGDEVRTNDAKDYTWTVADSASSFSGVANLFQNYDVKIEAGKSTVAKRQLTVSDIVASIIYGDQGNKGFQITSGGELEGIAYEDDEVSLKDSVDASGIKIVAGSKYDRDRNGRKTADVGTYADSLSYSGLTLTGDDAGNYYIDGSASGTIIVDKAQLTVGLGDVHRTYGSTAITTPGGYTVSSIEGLVNGDENLGYSSGDLTVTKTDDGALTGSSSGRVTNDANKNNESYTYTGTVTSTNESLDKNYKIVVNGSKGNTGTGKSYVDKANLTIDLNNVERVYGSKDLSDGYKYGISSIDGNTNGDNYGIGDFEFKLDKDNALAEKNSAGKVTNDANKDGESYTYTGTVTSTNERLNNNYNIVVEGSNNNTGTGTSKVNKANLTIDLSNVKMTYGQKENDEITKQYGYDASETEGQTLVNGDNLSGVITGMTYTNTAYNEDGSTKDVTKDGYKLKAGTVTEGTMAGNYNITYKAGTVDMDKATITVGLDTVERTYGNAAITNNGGKYSVADDIRGVTNGDSYGASDFTVTVEEGKDGALDTTPNDNRVTNDANTGNGYYTYTGTVTSTDRRLNNNYNIVVNGTGKSYVKKAEITVSADSHQIYVGAPEPTYTGTTIEGLLVNGDSLSTSYEYGPEGPVDMNQSGKTEIGIHFGDTYFGSGTDWRGVWDGFKNYSITFTPGTLTVEGMPSEMPEISDGEKWNLLLRDTPWDRNRNFRERKAEIHFIAGGMSY